MFLSEVDIVVHVAIVAYTTAYKSTVRTDPGKVLKFKVEILRSWKALKITIGVEKCFKIIENCDTGLENADADRFRGVIQWLCC